MAIQIRSLRLEDDGPWMRSLLTETWGGFDMISMGRVHRLDELPGLVALHGDRQAGLITYEIRGSDCEIVSLNSMVERHGIGSMLIEHVASIASDSGCVRLLVCTTNDNTYALRFYQRRDFHILMVNLDVIRQYRLQKPTIPLYGDDGIPIRDEIVLERLL